VPPNPVTSFPNPIFGAQAAPSCRGSHQWRWGAAPPISIDGYPGGKTPFGPPNRVLRTTSQWWVGLPPGAVLETRHVFLMRGGSGARLDGRRCGRLWLGAVLARCYALHRLQISFPRIFVSGGGLRGTFVVVRRWAAARAKSATRHLPQSSLPSKHINGRPTCATELFEDDGARSSFTPHTLRL
jgi:hypothetical protein